jgi:transaldolase
MKLFIESANTQEIRKIAAMGLVEGVVTSPSLIAATGLGLEETIREICGLVEAPVGVTAVSQGWEELVEEARSLSNLHRNVVVQIPATDHGLRAIRRLAGEGIRCNATLCFSPMQALLAAKCGAAYVSPQAGGLDDVGFDGMGLIEKTLQIYNNYNLPTQLLVSGVRHPMHVLEAALIGSDACAIPYETFAMLPDHPQTREGVRQSLEDWKQLPKN